MNVDSSFVLEVAAVPVMSPLHVVTVSCPFRISGALLIDKDISITLTLGKGAETALERSLSSYVTAI